MLVDAGVAFLERRKGGLLDIGMIQFLAITNGP